MIQIIEKNEYTKAVEEAFFRLLPQLSPYAKQPSSEEFAELLSSKNTHLLMAEEDEHILGMLTLVLFRIPTGKCARIEDVVVDFVARGKGVGERLVRTAIDLARMEGAKEVDLTSRPTREAANRLYRRCGFEPRETNVYRYGLD